MNLIISSKKFKLNESHKEYISEKIEHVLKFDPTIRQIRVECDADKKERNRQKFRIMVWVMADTEYKAGVQDLTLYSAVDHVVPLLKRLITRSRKKARDTKRSSRI